MGLDRWDTFKFQIMLYYIDQHKFAQAQEYKKTHLPEIIYFAINERLILPFDVINVFNVTGIQVLLYHKSKEAVIWSVSCKKQSRFSTFENIG